MKTSCSKRRGWGRRRGLGEGEGEEGVGEGVEVEEGVGDGGGVRGEREGERERGLIRGEHLRGVGEWRIPANGGGGLTPRIFDFSLVLLSFLVTLGGLVVNKRKMVLAVFGP